MDSVMSVDALLQHLSDIGCDTEVKPRKVEISDTKRHLYYVPCGEELLSRSDRERLETIEGFDDDITLLTAQSFSGLKYTPKLMASSLGTRLKCISKRGVKMLAAQGIPPTDVIPLDIDNAYAVVFKATPLMRAATRKGARAVFAPKKTTRAFIQFKHLPHEQTIKSMQKLCDEIAVELDRDLVVLVSGGGNYGKSQPPVGSLKDPLYIYTNIVTPGSVHPAVRIPAALRKAGVGAGRTRVQKDNVYIMAGRTVIGTYRPKANRVYLTADSYTHDDRALITMLGRYLLGRPPRHGNSRAVSITAVDAEEVLARIDAFYDGRDPEALAEHMDGVLKEAVSKDLAVHLRTAQALEETKRSLLRQIDTNAKQIRKQTNLVAATQQMVNEATGKGKTILREMLAIDKVLAVSVSDDGTFYITTDFIYCQNEVTKKYHRIGRFVIKLTINGGIGLSMLNATGALQGGRNAPHVNSSGRGCLGNTAEAFARLFADRELPSIAALAVNYLQTAAMDDIAGKTLTNWPVVEDPELDCKRLWEDETLREEHERQVNALLRKQMGRTQ